MESSVSPICPSPFPTGAAPNAVDGGGASHVAPPTRGRGGSPPAVVATAFAFSRHLAGGPLGGRGPAAPDTEGRSSCSVSRGNASIRRLEAMGSAGTAVATANAVLVGHMTVM